MGGESKLDPVLRWAVLKRPNVHSGVLQPPVYSFKSFVFRFDELIDGFGAQVLAISMVGGIGDFIKVAFQLIKPALSQTNVESDQLVWVCSFGLRPCGRSLVGVLDGICRPGMGSCENSLRSKCASQERT